MTSNRKVDISKEEIASLPIGCYEGSIDLITNPEDVEKAVTLLSKEAVVGFDTETKPAFKRGQRFKVALLQLATLNHVFLFRLHKTGLTKSLVKLLESENILKVGVGLRDDIIALQQITPFKQSGFVELSKMSTENGLRVEGIRKLSGLLLNIRISKSSQTSNWEAPELSRKQLTYAATDAWISLKIYHELNKL